MEVASCEFWFHEESLRQFIRKQNRVDWSCRNVFDIVPSDQQLPQTPFGVLILPWSHTRDEVDSDLFQRAAGEQTRVTFGNNHGARLWPQRTGGVGGEDSQHLIFEHVSKLPLPLPTGCLWVADETKNLKACLPSSSSFIASLAGIVAMWVGNGGRGSRLKNLLILPERKGRFFCIMWWVRP